MWDKTRSVSYTHLDVYKRQVFTPKGEIKTMPQNSTALDFAFSLHTDIGSHCIGAKVNHKLVPVSYTHLLSLYFLCGFACSGCEIFSLIYIDDTAAGVNNQPASCLLYTSRCV